MCILITACSKDSGTNNQDSNSAEGSTDSQKFDISDSNTSEISIYEDNPSYYAQGIHRIAETESGYFFMTQGVLSYLDKETNQAVIFSNDSITMEEALDQNGNALVESDAIFKFAHSVFYHNEKLYILEYTDMEHSTWTLLEVDPKTHARKTLTEFQSDSGNAALVNDTYYVLETNYLKIYQDSDLNENTDDGSKADSNVENSPEPAIDAEAKVKVEYKLTGFDLSKGEKLDSIQIPISDENAIDSPGIFLKISGYKDNVYIDFLETRNDKYIPFGDYYLWIYNTKENKFIERKLLEAPQSEAEGKNIFFTMLDENMYLSKSELPPVDKDNYEGLLEQEFLNYKADLYSDNQVEFPGLKSFSAMKSNGQDLFALPNIMMYNNKEGKRLGFDFDLYKFENNEWTSQYSVELSKMESMFIAFNSAISTNGDLFVYDSGGREIYIVRDGKVTTIYGSVIK